MKGWSSFFWVTIFVLLSGFVFEQGLRSWRADYRLLHQQWEQLELEKTRGLALRENLLLQLNSQSDPEWVQLTLMRELGVVAEGQKKIYFRE